MMQLAKGITLIELIISMVIIGISLTATLTALLPAVTRSSDALWQAKSVELIQAYLDEILAMKFDATTPLGGGAVAPPCAISADGEVRSAFNDVDDYNNLDNQPPVLLSGSSFASTYPDYRVQISVVCAGTEVGLPNDDFAKRIEITVTTPTGEQLTLNAYKGNF